jgi:hypothetical protein
MAAAPLRRASVDLGSRDEGDLGVSSAVNLPSMPHRDDPNDQSVVEDLGHDSRVALADAVVLLAGPLHANWEKWPKDLTRHTAASYWLAVDGNAVNVADQLGHSVAQLKTHDKALVTRADAERFWRLIPKGD